MVGTRRAIRLGVLAIGLAMTGCGSDSSTSSSRDASQPTSSPAWSATTVPPGGLQVLRDAYADVTGAEDIAWAPEVAVSYSGEPGITLRAVQADDPKSWVGCPANASEYAGRPCPLSPLETIEMAVSDGVRMVHEKEVPKYVGCDQPEPPDAPGDQVISVRPDKQHRDCFSDFAVTMYLDASGAVDTVDFVLSSP